MWRGGSVCPPRTPAGPNHSAIFERSAGHGQHASTGRQPIARDAYTDLSGCTRLFFEMITWFFGAGTWVRPTGC